MVLGHVMVIDKCRGRLLASVLALTVGLAARERATLAVMCPQLPTYLSCATYPKPISEMHT